MNKTYKIAFGLFLLLVISLVWLETTEPEPINWNPSYTASDKIALGAYIFHRSWKDTKNDDLREINIPPYEYLNNNPEKGTYFFLNNNVIFDDDELDDLLNWVSSGNRLFISAYNFGQNMEDTLGFQVSSFIDSRGFTSRPGLNLVNPDLKLKKALKFDQDLPAVYFEKLDTLNQVVMGTATLGEKTPEKKINFIRTDFGKGEILLHTTPQAFSNYFLLKDKNYRYAEAVLAYLSDGTILWDGYYKSGKSFFTSPLYILLNNRPLKWAYYFVIIASILFVLFEGKRKQRAIPVVEPLKNKSYEYTETVSQLYLEQKEYRELGLKKISLFLEFIRLNYRLDTTNINEEFFVHLASKSENTLEQTKILFERIFNFQDDPENSKNDFFELSKSINSFKENNGKSGKQS